MSRLSPAMLNAEVEAADNLRNDIVQRTVLDPLEAEVRAYCVKYGRSFFAGNGSHFFQFEDQVTGLDETVADEIDLAAPHLPFKRGERVALRQLLQLCAVSIDHSCSAGDLLPSMTYHTEENDHACRD